METGQLLHIVIAATVLQGIVIYVWVCVFVCVKCLDTLLVTRPTQSKRASQTNEAKISERV